MPIITNSAYSYMSWIINNITLWLQIKTLAKNNVETMNFLIQREKRLEEKIPGYFRKQYKVDQRELSLQGNLNIQLIQIQPKQGPTNKKIIIFLHGGAFLFKISIVHWLAIQDLIDALQCSILVPIYPKVPNGSYKDTCPQLLQLYKDTIKTHEPSSITFIGDSAGGWLAFYLAIQAKEQGLPQPGNIILMSPWFDLTMSNPECQKLESKDPILTYQLAIECGKLWSDKKDPQQHNLLLKELSGLGPVSIFCGGLDMLRPQSFEVYEKLKLVESEPLIIDYKNLMHGFELGQLPESINAIRQIVAIVKGQSIEDIINCMKYRPNSFIQFVKTIYRIPKESWREFYWNP